MWKVQNKINNKGVTLIELLVSLAIFSIATVFLAYTITATIRHNFRNSLRDTATTVMNNTINNLKSIDYDNITNKNHDECDKIIYNFGDENDNITYCVWWDVQEVNMSGSENNTLTFSNKLKRITIRVEWFKPYAVNEKDHMTAVFYKSQQENY
jgi:prepilin-type N-terminal cleavage/methylation domain-containing protein